MNRREELRVGWCPGALRPMASGDGLIARVKPRGARLTPRQAQGIADAALRHGNGALDLTSRANLQIRGVEEAGLPALTGALRDLDLLDPSPDAEAVRNVVSSPLAGLDRSAVLDITPVVAALEDRLVTDPALHGLPPKFGVLVDDGGRFGLDDVPADIKCRAFRAVDGPRFAVEVCRGGAGLTAGCGPPARAECAPGELAETVAALARRFTRTDQDGGSRLGDPGPGAIMPGVVGPLPGSVLGLAAPFGRLDAVALLRLAEAAARENTLDIRLTPWRAVLLPHLDAAASARVVGVAAPAGWIADPADPRLRVAACAGAPGCRRGSMPTLDHAAALARLLPRATGGRTISLHVSGCGKGCAHRGEAPVTLVGHDGVYDLVLGGAPGSDAAACGLSLAQAAASLQIWAERERRP